MPFWQGEQPSSVAELPGNFPISRVSGIQRFFVNTRTPRPLLQAGEEVPLFRKKVQVAQSGVVDLSWQVDCEHAAYDPGTGTNYPIGISGYVVWRRAATEAGLTGAFSFINTTCGASNIRDREYQHYETIGAAGVTFAVEGGYWYEFSLWLSGHSSAAGVVGVNGIARITPNGGENYLAITYWPGQSAAT